MAQALYISEIHMDLNEYTRMAMKVTEKSRRLKKIYADMPAIKDDYVRYEFYPDHFLVFTNRGDGEYRYDQITRYVETDEEIIMMPDPDQGMLLLKKNCSPDLIKFLREKCQR
jgi:hypothetical protein